MKMRRGYKAVREEEARREKAREESKGKLWRVFFPKDADEEYEIPVVFLTDEPLCYREHVVNVAGKISQHTCTEDDDCPYCAEGNKPRFVGAFLVVDRSTYETTDKKTNKKKKVKDRLKLLVRGTTDLAKLERLNKKYGLLGKEFNIFKTGSDTTTTWNFERGDKVKFSKKELENIIPESLQEYDDYYDIVEAQILPREEEIDEDEYEDDDDDTDDVAKGVMGMEDDEDEYDEDDEDEEEEEEEEDEPAPRKRQKSTASSRKSKSSKTRIRKRHK